MSPEEISKLNRYLVRIFDKDDISVKKRANQTDSVEVYVADEYIGLIYRVEDEGELSYSFEMAILDIDLDDLI